MTRPYLAPIVVFGTIAIVLFNGCGTTPKVDHPVVAAPPPRLKNAGGTARPIAPVQTAMLESEVDDEFSEVAATVNGEPIFTSEVIARYQLGLKQFKQKAMETENAAQREQMLAHYDQQKTKFILELLPDYVEQQMLNQQLREKFGGEVVSKVEEQLSNMFADEIATLKQRTGAKTIKELEQIMNENETSLAEQKRAFSNKQLAGYYLQQSMEDIPEVKRPDIVARYNTDIADYTQPADVKWQQLTISFKTHGGRVGALETLEKAAGDIQAGESFDVVIGRYSDGPMKKRAGMWDYVTRGSLSNKELEEKLFTLGVGEISTPIQTDKAYLMVRVADRRDERVTPLADVQDAIRQSIATERTMSRSKTVLADLWEAANIETPFDDDPRWQKIKADRMAAAADLTTR